MARFRIFYMEREGRDKAPSAGVEQVWSGITRGSEVFKETEWEEQVEAGNIGDALDSFFREHAGAHEDVLIVEEDGRGYPVPGLDYDPDRTYVWVEDGNLMEYQGITEATEGAVTCPLCDGTGEIDEDLAAEFEEVWNSAEYETYEDGAQGDAQG
jgi:hypothetical protein